MTDKGRPLDVKLFGLGHRMNNKIKKVAVIGCGIMGTQIAVLSAACGYEVTAYDVDENSLEKAMAYFKTAVPFSQKRPLLTLEEWEKGTEQLTLFKEPGLAVKDADLVIEAAPENLELKRKIFKHLDELAPGRAIIATNSSSIPISRLEKVIRNPRRCLNVHFYSLVLGANMADIMTGTETAAETVKTAEAWVRSLGCIPLTVKKEILGFCFNRVWRAVKRESLHMWAGGFVDFRDIDRAWMIAYGTPQGPFGMMDRIGLDVVYDIEMVYYNESKDPKDHPPDALKEMVERKECGMKTKKGFYTYPDPEYDRPDFLQ
jgi:3-hydroxybutyryl-CoA dehydrogenase